MTDPRHFREDVEHVPNSLFSLSEAIEWWQAGVSDPGL